ncbi:DUF3427 domain-containing protein [Clostridium botulinum]|nr:DUF3427 domain-containing protein [Clostridium botulinum]
MFKVGYMYSRKDIYNILKVPLNQQKGSWNTGYRSYKDKYYVFAGINTSGRTGHNHGNYWESDLLCWRGKNKSHINQPIIKKLLDNKTEVNIFTRSDSSNVYFTYQGKGQAAKYEDTIPVTIYWKFGMRNEEDYTNEELSASIRYPEGATKSVLVNAYERNR